MNLDFMLLADYASATVDGKLYIMGIFNKIFAASFPIIHSDMCLVARLSASPHEYNRNFKMMINLVDEDMIRIQSINTEAVVPISEEGETINLNHIVKLFQITFPHPGRYEFSLQVDNDLKGTLAVDLVQVKTVGA